MSGRGGTNIYIIYGIRLITIVCAGVTHTHTYIGGEEGSDREESRSAIEREREKRRQTD